LQFSSVFGNKNFDDRIDTPLLSSDFLNKMRGDLNMLAIPLLNKKHELKGLMRLFSSAKTLQKDFNLFEHAGATIGKFIEQVTTTRTQMQAMTS
jgi:hypothetical protein